MNKNKKEGNIDKSERPTLCKNEKEILVKLITNRGMCGKMESVQHGAAKFAQWFRPTQAIVFQPCSIDFSPSRLRLDSLDAQVYNILLNFTSLRSSSPERNALLFTSSSCCAYECFLLL